MTVVAGEGGELTAWVGQGTRDLVAGTLETYSAATAANLAASDLGEGERRVFEDRLEDLGRLLQQVDGTAGTVHMTGPADLIVAVIRATASQATYELDRLVEAIADGGNAPASEDDIALVRSRTTAATTCIEALIACESGRGQG